jgi:Fe-S cluster assembly protein SufD
MSRGIPRDVARKFIIMGFLEPVVARIPLTDAQDRLRQLLERKWPQDAAPAQQAA